MKINQWFNQGCNYDDGVSIYASIKQSNQNLVRLFKRKESKLNFDKLKYELGKYKDLEVSAPNTVIKVNPQVDFTQPQTNQSPTNNYRPLRLNELPVDLHPMFIQQKNDFYRACSLKISLNDLTAENEDQALEYCLEIERLFDSIEKAWKVFDHYKEFKVVPELNDGRDFEQLSPVLLLKAEKSKREAISKAKRAIATWTKKLTTTKHPKDQGKLTRQIQKKNEDLMSHELALEKIKELINKKP